MRAPTPSETSPPISVAPASSASQKLPGPQSGAQVPATSTTVLRVSYQGFLLSPNGAGLAVGYVQRNDERAARKESSTGTEVTRLEETQRRAVELREARERQEAFLRQTPEDSGYSWLLERQIMFHGGRIYVHDGPTDTLPSHDLAHLLVGMGTNLPWCPAGSDTEVRISEFNAAVLENLLSYTYEHVARGSVGLDEILPKTLQYARWFVEKHYAPFPIPMDEAYRRFCRGIDVDALADLAHYFYTQKEGEREGNRRDGPWEVRLVRQLPEGLDSTVQQFQSLIRSTLQSMKGRQAGPGATPTIETPATLGQPAEASAARNEKPIGMEAARTQECPSQDPARKQQLRDAKIRQEALLRRTPAGSGFSWLHDRQIMFHGRRIYVHDGPTETLPSHDLAHLLVGMGSNLPWCPTGSDTEVRISEFNAAVLENLLSYAYEHVARRSIALDDVLPKTLQYARWFVEKHYAPFPLPLDEAYRRFCLGIDAEAITNLAHYFFAQKESERGDNREGPWEMRLVRQPTAGLTPATQEFLSLIRNSLRFMKARQVGARASL